jgi:transcriptional regulator with XRE-family HTH domain
MSPSLSDHAETDFKAKALRLLAGDIRRLRKARGLTLAGLATQLGRSVGWLSQVERGISLPTLADLRMMANHFKVPVSFFFSPAPPDEKESAVIVRAGQRRRLAAGQMGVVEELLSPDLGGLFEMIRCEFAGGTSLPQPRKRAHEEAGYWRSPATGTGLPPATASACAAKPSAGATRRPSLRWSSGSPRRRPDDSRFAAILFRRG